MKNLKTSLKICFLLILIACATACKKDKANEQSHYVYEGTKYLITNAQQTSYNGNIRLEFTTGNAADYVLVDFVNVNTLPINVLTYNNNPNSASYDPQKNFNSVIFGASGKDNLATGGNITITRSDKNYRITFDLLTEKGKLTGIYNGTPDQL